jgi:hypothetical protein
LNKLELLEKNLQQHSEAMSAICDIPPEGEVDIRDDVVKKIIIRISELTRGASTIGFSKNITVLAILARQILESLITLLWIISDKNNVQKYLDASKYEFQRIAKINMESGLLKVLTREGGRDETANFIKQRFTEKLSRAPSTEQQAKEAGVLDLYNIFYRFMSLDVHGKTETIIDENEKESDTIIRLQGVGALSMASGHSATLWILHREKMSNEALRKLMGFNAEEMTQSPNAANSSDAKTREAD